MSDVKPVAWADAEMFARFVSDDKARAIGVFDWSNDPSDVPLYSQEIVTALQAEIEALRKDARYVEYGRVAMRFVDRAGDVHPGIDDAETICAEFYEAMSKAIDAAIAKEKQP